MNKNLRTFTVWVVMVTLLMALMPPINSVYAVPEDDYTWIAYGNEALITDYRGTSTDIVIPSHLDGLTVTSIVYEAFKGKQLTSVTIPDTVTEIGDEAFKDNQLTSVNLPTGLTSIGQYAFEGNKLTSVTIPTSITKISNSAFANNQLTSISIPKGVAIIEDLAFRGNQLRSVEIPNSVIEIGSYAFYENQLTGVSIPDSVTEIGFGAFEDNQLKDVTISKNVTVIRDMTFASNQLTRVDIPDSVREIGIGAFQGNQLTILDIPNRVEEIGIGAFADNQLTFVSIPKSVTSIGSGAFYQNQLRTVIIHNKDVTIGTEIIIPEGTIPAAFADNQSNPADLTMIGQAGSTAEAYALEYGHTFVSSWVEKVEVEVLDDLVEAERLFYLQVSVDEAMPITGAVDHHVQVVSNIEGTLVDEVISFNRYSSNQSRKGLDLRLTYRGEHELSVTIDGVTANPMLVYVEIYSNTLNRLREEIEEAKRLWQLAVVGEELGQYVQESVDEFQQAIQTAEEVLINGKTNAEISNATVALMRQINLFEYYQIIVYEAESIYLHLLAAEGRTFRLPDQVKGLILIPVSEDGKPITYNEIRDVPVTWYTTDPQAPITEVDLSKPGIYRFKGQIEYFETDGQAREAELTVAVLEAETPERTEIGGKPTVVFDNGTMVQGLPPGVSLQAAEITSNHIPNEWNPWDDEEWKVNPVGGVIKLALDGVRGPIQFDILIPLKQDADPGKAILAYYNESKRSWEWVQGSEIVEIDSKLYAKVTLNHNSIYGVVEVNARLVANGLQVASPAKHATQLILPEVPKGYAIEIAWSSDETIIDLDGNITPLDEETTVEIDLKVFNTQNNRDYEYIEYVEIVVPAKSSSSGGGSSGGGGGTRPAANSSQISTSGGTVTLNNVTLTFPAKALGGIFKVTVEKVSGRSSLSLAEGMLLASGVFEITKDKSGRFAKPIILTIPFDKSVVDLAKYDLAVYWLDEETDEWIKLDNVEVDINKGVVSGEVDHFTKFAVIATEKEAEIEQPVQVDEWEKVDQTEEPDAVQLTDIAGHWAEANIQALINLGAISGYPDGTFLPNNYITRAEFATVLVKAFSLETSGSRVFNDTAHHWAKDAIATAAAHDIVSGYNETTFGANDQITREQMAVMIARTVNLQTNNLQANNRTVNLTDVEIMSPWAVEAILAAVQAEIITGYPDQRFKPHGHASRAEAVTLIMKALVQ